MAAGDEAEGEGEAGEDDEDEGKTETLVKTHSSQPALSTDLQKQQRVSQPRKSIVQHIPLPVATAAVPRARPVKAAEFTLPLPQQCKLDNTTSDRKTKTTIQCRSCGEDGQLRRRCQRKQASAIPSYGGMELICFGCGEPGHIQRNCPGQSNEWRPFKSQVYARVPHDPIIRIFLPNYM